MNGVNFHDEMVKNMMNTTKEKEIIRIEIPKDIDIVEVVGLKEWLDEHDKQIRAEVIDEFVKAIEKHQTRQDSYLEPPYIEMGLDMTDVLEVAKQLKKGAE